MNVSERFWSKVQKTDGCWLWVRARTNGYGSFGFAGKTIPAHRWSYAETYGPIPEGLTIDHTCHNQDPTCHGGTTCPHRACVRPDHLEAVGLGANIVRSGSTLAGINLRKETCPLGHELVRTPKGDRRYCAACQNKRTRERQTRRRREAGIPVGRGIREKMKTHCPQGHEYTPENTRITSTGGRVCRQCGRERYHRLQLNLQRKRRRAMT